LLTAFQNFIAQILTEDKDACIIASGDFSEFAFVSPIETFTRIAGLQDLDEATGIKKAERYTYMFDMNCQQLDQGFVSKALTNSSFTKKAEFKLINVNI